MFNVGDIVTLKPGLIPFQKYGNLTYLYGMNYYANQKLKIKNAASDKTYKVEDCNYVFSEEMLEFYNEKAIIPSPTHNFKIGDTVTIRKDLTPCNLYQHVAFVNGMSKYKGQTFKIKNIVGALSNTYTLETLDSNEFWFTEEMFEPQPYKCSGVLSVDSLYPSLDINVNIDKEYKWEAITEYKSISKQVDKIKKDINSNKITITEVIINPCKKEIYTL